MSWIEAAILGLVQGLTEFLPVSSSGHLAIGQSLLGANPPGVMFEVTVHAATVLSTIVVFYKDIVKLLGGLFRFKMNSETRYIINIVISMIPVIIVGLFFKDYVERVFGSGLTIVGISLLITALLLYISSAIRPGNREIGPLSAFITGIAQAVAVLPGLSRSGATISTGLILGIKKEEMARFSFLMVLVPILGEAFMDLTSGDLISGGGVGAPALCAGFLTAFLSGLFACKMMINIVSKFKLTGFALYCAAIGIICLVLL
jgi:undecaprenyl-diphosphatase